MGCFCYFWKKYERFIGANYIMKSEKIKPAFFCFRFITLLQILSHYQMLINNDEGKQWVASLKAIRSTKKDAFPLIILMEMNHSLILQYLELFPIWVLSGRGKKNSLSSIKAVFATSVCALWQSRPILWGKDSSLCLMSHHPLFVTT